MNCIIIIILNRSLELPSNVSYTVLAYIQDFIVMKLYERDVCTIGQDNQAHLCPYSFPCRVPCAQLSAIRQYVTRLAKTGHVGTNYIYPSRISVLQCIYTL